MTPQASQANMGMAAAPTQTANTNLFNGPSSVAAQSGQPYYGTQVSSSSSSPGPTYTGASPTPSGGPNFSYTISPNGSTVSWTNSSGQTFTAARNV